MKQKSSERGFVLAALLFFITATAVVLATLVPSYIMQSRRDTEDELIFRGAEYARAIRKYQNKCGLLPLTTDELIQGCGDGIPTLRKHYLDPTNGEEFRMIYVNPDGTLQGSNIYLTLRDARTNTAQTMTEVAEALADDVAANGGGTGTGAAGGAAGAGVPNTGAAANLNNQGTGLNNQGTTLGNNRGTNLLANQGTNLTQTGQNTTTPAPTTAAPAATGGTTTQQTGLVGVGSTNDKIAVKKYINQDRYVNWEFIANVNRTGRGAAQTQNTAATGNNAAGTTATPGGLNNQGTNLNNNQGTALPTGGAATGGGATGGGGGARGGGGGGGRGGN